MPICLDSHPEILSKVSSLISMVSVHWFLLLFSASTRSSFASSADTIQVALPTPGVYSTAAGSRRRMFVSTADGVNFAISLELFYSGQQRMHGYSSELTAQNAYTPTARPDLLWFMSEFLVAVRGDLSSTGPLNELILEYSYLEKAFILRIDTELIRADLVDVDPEGRLYRHMVSVHEWKKEYINEQLVAYAQLMLIKREYPDFEAKYLSPSPVIDDVWHIHILDLRRYFQFCMRFAGRVIEHDIERALDGQVVKEARLAVTRAGFSQLFGYKPHEEFWGEDPEEAKSRKMYTGWRFVRERKGTRTTGTGPVFGKVVEYSDRLPLGSSC